MKKLLLPLLAAAMVVVGFAPVAHAEQDTPGTYQLAPFPEPADTRVR